MQAAPEVPKSPLSESSMTTSPILEFFHGQSPSEECYLGDLYTREYCDRESFAVQLVASELYNGESSPVQFIADQFEDGESLRLFLVRRQAKLIAQDTRKKKNCALTMAKFNLTKSSLVKPNSPKSSLAKPGNDRLNLMPLNLT